MTRDRFGSYEIIETLGSGGMGVVYRARELEGDRAVALKTVKVTDANALAGMRREIHALARIRHPGIVSILGEGVKSGLPWYAMELVRGKTLRDLLREEERAAQPTVAMGKEPSAADADADHPTTAVDGTRPLDATVRVDGEAPSQKDDPLPDAPRKAAPLSPDRFARLLFVMERLCHALAYLHGEGLVHRDLKPENIMIREDGRPVLMDFGLVSRFGGGKGRESVQVVGSTMGTVAYMSPEQACGDAVDARSDLYSLGCILYEVLSGEPPFVSDEPMSVLVAHVNRMPTPLAATAPFLPKDLTALVMRLLAKAPSLRYGYAMDVGSVLARHLPAPPPREDEPTPRLFLYPARFSGRHAQLQSLKEELREAEAGIGRLVLVEGAAGVGKTRLVNELLRTAPGESTVVISGECREAGSGDAYSAGPLGPFRPFLQAVADRCREEGEETTRRILGDRGRLLALYETGLWSLPGIEDSPEPAQLDAKAARVRLFNYLAATLDAFRDGRPLIYVIDDLHYGDDLTLGFLRYLGRSRFLERRPVALFCLFRKEETDGALADLEAAGMTTVVSVASMDRVTVKRMVDDMLAQAEASADFIDFVVGQTEGNPYFLTEYLRAAVEEGLLQRDPDGSWRLAARADARHIPLPGTVRELLARRLSALPPEAGKVSRAAAILGREAEDAILARTAGLAEPGYLDGVAVLRANGILEDARDGRLRFTSDNLRAVAYQEIPAAERQELHRRAAAAIVERHGEDPGELLGSLARHYEGAGLSDRARPAYLAAAKRAVSRYANREAEDLYRAYKRLCVPGSREEIQAIIELADDVLAPMGRFAEASTLYERGMDHPLLSEPGDLAGRFFCGAAVAETNMGRIAQADRLLQRAGRLAERMEPSVLHPVLGLRIGRVRQLQGMVTEAAAAYRQALSGALSIDRQDFATAALSNLASVELRGGNLDEADRLYRQALETARQAGLKREEGRILGNLGTLHHIRGDVEEARRLYQRALAIHRETGNVPPQVLALENLGGCAKQGGDYHEARRLFEEALEIAFETEDRERQGTLLSALAELLFEEGRPAEAAGLCRQALRVHREIENRSFEGTTLRILAACDRQSGSLKKAEEVIDRACAILEEVGDALELAMAHCERGEIRLAQGLSTDRDLRLAEETLVRLHLGKESELAGRIARLREGSDAEPLPDDEQR